MEFFARLLESDFMPHGHCYYWTPDILGLHVVSDAIIALAYFSIPLALITFTRRRQDLAFHWIFWLFASFIILCGVTHLAAIWTTWQPYYRLEGILKAVTASVSLLTAILLWPLIPKAIGLPSPAQLRAVNEKLLESEQLKDDFFRRISHELRTPLTLIITPLEAILADGFGPIANQQRQVLESMHNNTVRLLQMVNQLLDFSKLDAGRTKVLRTPMEIVRLTRAVVEDFQLKAQLKKLTCRFESSRTEAFVEMDQYLYERVLFNLLSNALKYTPPGGSIGVKLSTRKDRLFLHVSDTGIGFSSAQSEHLFKQFEQLEDTPIHRVGGTGLGLAMVREISQLLGGDVQVQSEEGQGAAFLVDLFAPETGRDFKSEPAELLLHSELPRYETGERGETAGPIRISASAPKILIAEDNDELAMHLILLLQQSYNIQHAPDGVAALGLIHASPPDLVLSDVLMPRMGGFELCRQLKAESATAQIPVVLLTSQTDRESLLHGWEAGADEYIVKPFHPQELKTRLESLLRLNGERIQAERALLQTNRDLETLLYVASHDLKEPLRGIKGFASLMQRRYSKQVDERGQDFLQRIVDSVNRMEQLINDLLTLSRAKRLQRGEMPVELNAVVQDVLARLDLVIQSSEAVIEVEESLPVLKIDKKWVTEAVYNLVSNAIKYAAAGQTPKIEIGSYENQDEAGLVVRDRGPGVAPKHSERIFELFQRAVGRQIEGTGAGLAIVRQVAERHGGRTWVQPREGGGSEFFITFSTRGKT